MRTFGLAVLLFAGAALAQDAPPPAGEPASPDYSRPSLLRLLADQPRPEHEPRIRFRVGAVEFNALGTQWRFVYLPIMMPLSGSEFRVTQTLPDPFLLTGVQIATPPRVWNRERRAFERELKRINKSSKVKIEVRGD